MRGSSTLPNLDALKDQAKRLRTSLGADGTAITHAKSLELVARQQGFRDWNTLHAAAGNGPPARPALAPGLKVSGHYLGQAFTGEILAVQVLTSAHGRQRITVHFDEPVDVVTFDSFSAFRQRVSCTVDENGRTPEKTSNGRPQMELVW